MRCNKNFKVKTFLLISLVIIITGCYNKQKKADIPDVRQLYDNISYLDSLLQSYRVDSLARAASILESTIASYANQAQSPDDIAILDSLGRIINLSNDFLRFCTDSRSNLELLRRDISVTEAQYQSGKIKLGYFITALIESEQILVDINSQFGTGLQSTLQALHGQRQLVPRLSPLPTSDF
jgi:hypothetical protein